MRSQSLSLQTSPNRGKAWERRQFLVKAEIQSPFAASTPVDPAVRQEGFTLWRKEVVEDREEELLVEVSQNREVQRSRGGREARAAPGGSDPVIWLASWHKQSSKKSKNKTR